MPPKASQRAIFQGLTLLLCLSFATSANAKKMSQSTPLLGTWHCGVLGKVRDQIKLSHNTVLWRQNNKQTRYHVTHRITMRHKQQNQNGLVLFLKLAGKRPQGAQLLGTELHVYEIRKGVLGFVSPFGGFYRPKNQSLGPYELARRSHPHWRRWSRHCFSSALLRSWSKLRSPLKKTQVANIDKWLKPTYKKSCQFTSPYDARLCMREVCLLLCMRVVFQQLVPWMSKKGIHPLKGVRIYFKYKKEERMR